jgi:hypothetical protein
MSVAPSLSIRSDPLNQNHPLVSVFIGVSKLAFAEPKARTGLRHPPRRATKYNAATKAGLYSRRRVLIIGSRYFFTYFFSAFCPTSAP